MKETATTESDPTPPADPAALAHSPARIAIDDMLEELEVFYGSQSDSLDLAYRNFLFVVSG